MIANSPIPADVPLASPETGAVIEVRDLVKSFGRRKVLNGISFKVVRGETIVIMGGSGCGKSTILRHLIGSMKPDAGSIRIFGEEIIGMDQREMDRIRCRFRGSLSIRRPAAIAHRRRECGPAHPGAQPGR